MALLFAHVSWMPEYSGRLDEPIFSTHGWVVQQNEAHERSNFKAIDGQIYGYVPVRQMQRSKEPGHIDIGRLGATKNQEYIDGVTVVWFANDPKNPKNAYIIGLYRNARVFRDLQFINGQEYRITCKGDDATLISEASRNFEIPHIRSEKGQDLGFGYGQSSIWYAESAAKFCSEVYSYIAAVDEMTIKISGRNLSTMGDAINDLDESIIGNQAPGTRFTSGSVFVRDDRIRKMVVIRSEGKCEYCGVIGFQKLDGTYFVEAHHIISLAEQGPDTLANVIALCPNHHRQAHFGVDREKLEAAFLTKLAEIRGK